jgi:hypothetical protein
MDVAAGRSELIPNHPFASPPLDFLVFIAWIPWQIIHRWEYHPAPFHCHPNFKAS